jgi:hypothetical protein
MANYGVSKVSRSGANRPQAVVTDEKGRLKSTFQRVRKNEEMIVALSSAFFS